MSKNLTENNPFVNSFIKIGLFLSFNCSLLPNFTSLLYKITFIRNLKGYNFGCIKFFQEWLVAAVKLGLMNAVFSAFSKLYNFFASL